MASGNESAPIIIKRKKIVAGDGHHGGAWKVAYADFVTAMMAFFMLMWLLNATTEKQRKGLADYFSPNISISRVSGGGEKDLRGDSVFAEDTLPQNGTGATDQKQSKFQSELIEDQRLHLSGVGPKTQEELDKILRATLVESLDGNSLMPHVSARFTDEGYAIRLNDLPTAELFDGTTPSDLLVKLSGALTEFAELTNQQIALKAAVASFPVVLDKDPTWPVSQARAEAFYTQLLDAGLNEARIARMTALGDRYPVQENPMNIRNNRLEFVLLK